MITARQDSSNEFEGSAGSQGASSARAKLRKGSAVLQPVHQILVDRHLAAGLLGVSQRTFEDLIDEPWMPRPVQLGERLLRWPVHELMEAIARMPRRLGKGEAVRERIARMKDGGGERREG